METAIDATPPKPSDPAGDDLSTTTTSKKRPKSSWIWNYGNLILETETKYWVCNLCPNKSNPQRYQVSSGTQAAASHLKSKHQVEEGISTKKLWLDAQQWFIQEAFSNAERAMEKKKKQTLQEDMDGKKWTPESYKLLMVSAITLSIFSTSDSSINTIPGSNGRRPEPFLCIRMLSHLPRLYHILVSRDHEIPSDITIYDTSMDPWSIWGTKEELEADSPDGT
jgi:hypothetical protein